MKKLGLLVVFGILLILPLFVNARCLETFKEGERLFIDDFNNPNICFDGCIDGKVHTFEITNINWKENKTDITDNTLNARYLQMDYKDKELSKMSDISSDLIISIDNQQKMILLEKTPNCEIIPHPECTMVVEERKTSFYDFDNPNICFKSCNKGEMQTFEIKKIYQSDNQVDISNNDANEFYSKLGYVDKNPSKMYDISSEIELIIDNAAKTIEVAKVVACQTPECIGIILNEGEGAIFDKSERVCFKSCVDGEMRTYEIKNIYWSDNQIDISDNTKNQFYSKIDFIDKNPSKMSDISPNIELTINKNTKIVRLNSISKCTNGVVPEQNPATSQEIITPAEKCQGCLINDKCIPYGTRTEGSYCSLSGNMTSQKQTDNFCENNYECDSNLCVSTKCISSSLWDKITQWFSKIFGIQPFTGKLFKNLPKQVPQGCCIIKDSAGSTLGCYWMLHADRSICESFNKYGNRQPDFRDSTSCDISECSGVTSCMGLTPTGSSYFLYDNAFGCDSNKLYQCNNGQISLNKDCSEFGDKCYFDTCCSGPEQTILLGDTIGGVTISGVDATGCTINYAGKPSTINKEQAIRIDDGSIISVINVVIGQTPSCTIKIC